MSTLMDEERKFIPTYYMPPRLSTLAADIVTRCLIYEDYEECNFYR